MGQLEDILRFEEEEQDRYLATYFPFDEAKGYFPPLDEQQYQQLLADTKRGIRRGVQEYLKQANPSSPPPSIYFIDIGKFSISNNVPHFVRSEIKGKYEESGDSYCQQAGSGYGAFLLNYSHDEYRRRFSTFLPQRAYG